MQNAVFSIGLISIPRQSPLHTLKTLKTAATLGILPALIDAWKTHGDLCEIRLGPYRIVLVVQPAHIRQVMVEDREVFTKDLGAGLLMERVQAFVGKRTRSRSSRRSCSMRLAPSSSAAATPPSPSIS